MLIGYARVSTHDQNLELQLDALKAAGCESVFEDKTSGTRAARPGLTQALEQVRKGDTLVVWRLDRLGRSLRHLIEVVAGLEQRGVGFRSLQESIDTTNSGGSSSSTSSVHWRSSSETSSRSVPWPGLLPRELAGERAVGLGS